MNSIEKLRPIALSSLAAIALTVVTVADEGPGIPADRHADVWRPFVRLEEQDASATGCGIGLSIVSELVELHGGRRSIRAREGGGSIFVVDVPAAHAVEPAGAALDGRAPVDSALGAAAS